MKLFGTYKSIICLDCLLGFWGVWGAIVLIQIFIGLGDSSWAIKECAPGWRRIEYILPGYKLGCWLGERVK